MTTHTTKTYIKGKYRIKEYYTDQIYGKKQRHLLKRKNKNLKKKNLILLKDQVEVAVAEDLGKYERYRNKNRNV